VRHRKTGDTEKAPRWRERAGLSRAVLQWVMVEAAQAHVHKYDTSIARAYNRISERKGWRIAVVAAARRLLMCCYSGVEG
jgi:fatty-acid desaturase